MFIIRKGRCMKRRFAFKAWVYFLCVSFLLLASGFHTVIVEAKEMSHPLGEMVSWGEVMFESRKAVWKNVELSQFPIFPGIRIKTEKGASLVTLEGNCQIEIREKSLLAFDRNDQIRLTEGTIDFRLPSTTELSFKVGDLTVIPSKSFQASNSPLAVSPKSEATIGSISVHSNGAVTVKSLQGSLSVLNKERIVLAALSSKDSVTIPSAGIESDSSSGEFLGFSKVDWFLMGILFVTEAAGIGAGIAIYKHNNKGHHYAPVCP